MALCMICTQKFEAEDDEALVTSCGHMYHKECLFKWMPTGPFAEQHGSCPTCRTIIAKGSLKKVYLSFERFDYRYEELEKNNQKLQNELEKLKQEIQKKKEVQIREKRDVLILPKKRAIKRKAASLPIVCVKRTRHCVYHYTI